MTLRFNMLPCTVCVFKPVKGRPLIFICPACRKVHRCGDGTCDSLFYNGDFTQVCSLTGLCFNQRMCDTYATSHEISRGRPDTVYVPRTKRDQQIQNRVLTRLQVAKVVNCASAIVHLTKSQEVALCSDIIMLWSLFVSNITDKGGYIRRKDKRCFVVAVVMSLRDGIMTDGDAFIVKPHPSLSTEKLNKKSVYAEFNVTDIRYGQTLIKRAFSGIGISSSNSISLR